MRKLKAVAQGLGGLLLAVSLLFLTGCPSPVSKIPKVVEPEVIKSLKRYKKEFVLAPGDVIEVVIYRSEDLTRTVGIRQDGFISLPLLDEVKAAGLTVKQLDDLLTKGYSARLIDPEVTVIVTNPHEPVVFVMGEVALPKAVPLRDARTAAQAIARVGGLARTAAMDHIAIIRLEVDGHIHARVVRRHDAGQPAYYMALQSQILQADDLIVVPESRRSQFIRTIEDFINTPVGGINQLLTPYFQFTLISEISN